MSDVRKKLGILISGRGSNMQAIIEHARMPGYPAAIAVVISNKARAGGLDLARAAGIATEVVSHREFATREQFDAALVEKLLAHGVEWVAMAGFMRVVTPVLLNAFPGRVLNIHPSLLPAFPGANGQGDALAYGCKVAGCTVHFVDEGMDAGPIILQAVVPVYDDDDEEKLRARILVEEHRVFPLAVRLALNGHLRIDGRKVRIVGLPEHELHAIRPWPLGDNAG